MKALFLVAGVTALVTPEVFADSPEVVTLNRFADLGVEPLASNKLDCPPDEGGMTLVGGRVIAKTRIWLWHQCALSDEFGMMVMKVGDEYFNAQPMTIRYMGATMTDAPERLTLVSDRIIAGTLFDGSPAVVQAVTTHSRMVFWQTGKLDSETFDMHTQVCSLDAAPACVNVEAVRCAKTGCAQPTLTKGTLRIVDRDRKAHVFTIERDPSPQPPL